MTSKAQVKCKVIETTLLLLVIYYDFWVIKCSKILIVPSFWLKFDDVVFDSIVMKFFFATYFES